MPARKHREGDEHEEWLAKKERFQFRAMVARQAAKQISGHTLMRLDEAAAFLSITKKTLRELERQGLPNWPQRVTLTPKVTGYRLKDLEALVDSGLAPAEAEAAQ